MPVIGPPGGRVRALCEPDEGMQGRLWVPIWPERHKHLNNHGFMSTAKPNWWYGDFPTGTGRRRQLDGLGAVPYSFRAIWKGESLDAPGKQFCRPSDPLEYRKGFAFFASSKRMGRPTTLLEGLCGHALSLGAHSIGVEYRDGREWVFARKGGMDIGIANYTSSSADAKELRGNLYAASKKPGRSVIGRQVYILKVGVFESFGEDAFAVSIDPAPKLDPSIPPLFTAKQGQYLAFIYNYTKIHRQAPAESDLEGYFRVSPPAIHDMIKTLERNGLIERTPGQARSIRLLVQPDHLPRLE